MNDRERYHRAAHAMQSGVALEHQYGSNDGTPKHLRVGINAAMRDQASLVQLLIAKGVFTEAEYLTAIADGMEEEAEIYRQRISTRLGREVHLGTSRLDPPQYAPDDATRK